MSETRNNDRRADPLCRGGKSFGPKKQRPLPFFSPGELKGVTSFAFYSSTPLFRFTACHNKIGVNGTGCTSKRRKVQANKISCRNDDDNDDSALTRSIMTTTCIPPSPPDYSCSSYSEKDDSCNWAQVKCWTCIALPSLCLSLVLSSRCVVLLASLLLDNSMVGVPVAEGNNEGAQRVELDRWDSN